MHSGIVILLSLLDAVVDGGLKRVVPPCAGLEAENFQRVDLFWAFVLKVASLRSNRRTSTCDVSFEMEHRRQCL